MVGLVLIVDTWFRRFASWPTATVLCIAACSKNEEQFPEDEERAVSAARVAACKAQKYADDLVLQHQLPCIYLRKYVGV